MINIINIISNNNYITHSNNPHSNIFNFIKNFLIYKIIITNLQEKLYLFYKKLFFNKNKKYNINKNFYKKIYII